MIQRTLYRTLHDIRTYHDYTLDVLAEYLNIDTHAVVLIECGITDITLPLLQQYSDIFDIPVSSILFLSECTASTKATQQLAVTKTLNILDYVTTNRQGQYANN